METQNETLQKYFIIKYNTVAGTFCTNHGLNAYNAYIIQPLDARARDKHGNELSPQLGHWRPLG